MVCSNCGNQIGEGIAFCPFCGTQTAAQAQPQQPDYGANNGWQAQPQQPDYGANNGWQAQPQQPDYGANNGWQAQPQQPDYGANNGWQAQPQQPDYGANNGWQAQQPRQPGQPKRNNKKLGIIIGAVVAVAVAAVVIFLMVGGSGSYEEKVDDFLNLYYHYNFDKGEFLDMAPDAFWQDEAREEDTTVDEICDEIRSQCNRMRENYKEELSTLKVNHEIKYVEQFDKDDCVELREAIEARYDMSYGEITEAYAFELDVEIEMEGEHEEDSYNVVAVKMDGEWYLLNAKNCRWLVEKFL